MPKGIGYPEGVSPKSKPKPKKKPKKGGKKGRVTRRKGVVKPPTAAHRPPRKFPLGPSAFWVGLAIGIQARAGTPKTAS